jgi:hypothetical protein
MKLFKIKPLSLKTLCIMVSIMPIALFISERCGIVLDKNWVDSHPVTKYAIIATSLSLCFVILLFFPYKYNKQITAKN